MKALVLIAFTFIVHPLFGQFFVNTLGLVGIGNGAIVTVQNMDAENQGDISHAGDMEVTGNIINSNIWVCNLIIPSRIMLTLDWTNNASFSSGIGKVEFNGTNQTMGGTNQTIFYKLILNGVVGNRKTQQNTIWCLDSFYLNNVELATNGNTFSLRNGIIPVQRGSGYISTFNNGWVKVVYPVALAGNTIVPLGYWLNSSQYKPVYLINPAQDSFNISLYGNSPTLDGRSSASLQDSLCSINDNYYYRIQTFNSPLFFAITQSPIELNYTKLARWNGTKWDKISKSAPAASVGTQNLGLNSQQTLITEYISQGHEKPFVNAGSDLNVMPGSTAQLIAKGYFPKGSTFLWNPDFDLSCSDCPNPIFTMGSPGIYTVTVSNGLNCEDTDTLIISKNINYKNLIGNAFSPNNDKLNETFGPVLLPGDKLEKLEIYNRWGERLFEGTENWDGRYQGQLVMQGVYVYLITISSNSGGTKTVSKFSGDVTLLR